jgi:hypothetical protein
MRRVNDKLVEWIRHESQTGDIAKVSRITKRSIAGVWRQLRGEANITVDVFFAFLKLLDKRNTKKVDFDSIKKFFT